VRVGMGVWFHRRDAMNAGLRRVTSFDIGRWKLDIAQTKDAQT
jgi:hypothetical protein